jgi:hypothetical protein
MVIYRLLLQPDKARQLFQTRYPKVSEEDVSVTIDWNVITDDIVRLRELTEPPLTFVQIEWIVKALHPGLHLTWQQVRDVYCAVRLEGSIVPRSAGSMTSTLPLIEKD